MSILVAGGDADPNIQHLLAQLNSRGDSCIPLLVGPESHPLFCWDMEKDDLLLNGEKINPGGVFIRHDVFSEITESKPQSSYRSFGWYSTILGWAISHPTVRLLNAGSACSMTNKLHVLQLAKKVGLETPYTMATNDLYSLETHANHKAMVAKPVTGGGYCQELDHLLKSTQRINHGAAVPAIIQNRLVPPEIRVYIVNHKPIAFQLESDALDYRTAKNVNIISIEPPPDKVKKLCLLMEALNLNFAAADFKTCPDSGDLKFLEINNGPMFAAFDQVCDSAISNAIIDFLI